MVFSETGVGVTDRYPLECELFLMVCDGKLKSTEFNEVLLVSDDRPLVLGYSKL